MMQEVFNKLAGALFTKNKLEDCSIEELRLLIEQYPYFTAAQLALTMKLKVSSEPDYNEQLQKTSIHFNNSLWVDFLLNGNEKEIISPIAEAIINLPVQIEDTHNDEIVVENPRYEIPSVPKEVTVKESIAEKEYIVQTIEVAKAEEPAFVFEPYHTVDYFASQGIKQVITDKPADRLGQQLKSFTEWLKTIRKMPPQEVSELADANSEKKVVDLAVHSIEDRNVVTESMAEVWIKQDQPEKAIEIYSKLSLLNPSKSSYFASLIENLKKN